MAKVMVAIEADDPEFIPTYAHPTDAGADLKSSEEISIGGGGQQAVVDCGISIAIQPGYVGLIHPRSGLAAKRGVTILNTPGTIDAGYRGRIKAILINHGSAAYHIKRGDRIAQLVVQPVLQAHFREVDNIADQRTARGAGGLGSTGE